MGPGQGSFSREASCKGRPSQPIVLQDLPGPHHPQALHQLTHISATHHMGTHYMALGLQWVGWLDIYRHGKALGLDVSPAHGVRHDLGQVSVFRSICLPAHPESAIPPPLHPSSHSAHRYKFLTECQATLTTGKTAVSQGLKVMELPFQWGGRHSRQFHE